MSDFDMPCAFHLKHARRKRSGCQFDVPEGELVSFDGKSWCSFHLPLQAGEVASEKASWDRERIDAFNETIFDRIDRPPIEVVSVLNRLILPGTDRPKPLSVDLAGVIFPAKISFGRYSCQNHALRTLTLSHATFAADAVFEGTMFSDMAYFDGATFKGTANFERATFESAIFTGAAFEGAAIFEDVVFTSASFDKIRFGSKARFKGVTFKEYAWFTSTEFGDRGANFNKVTFGNVSFRKAIFNGSSLFIQAKFIGERCNFEEAEMHYCNFDHSRFTKHAWFRRVKFHEGALFNCVEFDCLAMFIESIFMHHSGFCDSIFKKEAMFRGIVFNGVTFDRSHFDGDAYFVGSPTVDLNGNGSNSSIFSGAYFCRTLFKGRANFNNRFVNETTDFSEATFATAPEFHNCVLHQETRFPPRRNFKDVVGLNDEDGNKIVDAALAYRTLKLAMGNVRAVDEEAMFYALEQQSLRRRRDTPWWVKVFSWLYEKSADYGHNFARPLGWLLASFGFFFLIYLAFHTDPIVSWPDIEEKLWFTFQQVFHLFSLLGERAGTTSTERVSLGLAVLSALHSLLTLVFLALFLLALRRRFKLH